MAAKNRLPYWSVLLLGLCHSVTAQESLLKVKIDKWAGDISPISATSLESFFVIHQIYEPLIELKPDGTLAPALASDWRANQSKTKFAFTIDSKARFSDGESVSASDVETMLKDRIRSGSMRGFDRIDGALNYRIGKATTLTGFHALSKHGFIITLSKSYPGFVEELSNFTSVVYKSIKGSNLPIGTGPFSIGRLDNPGQTLILQLNSYHKKSRPHFDRVFISPNTNFFPDLDFTQDSVSRKSGGYYRVDYFDPEVHFIGFNPDNPKLKEIGVRATLASFVSKTFVRNYLPGCDYEVRGYVPKGVIGYDPTFSPTYFSETNLGGKTFLVLFYESKFSDLAEGFCKKLEQNKIGCVSRLVTLNDIHKFRDDNTLEIFIGKRTADNAELLFSDFNHADSFLPRTPNNPIREELESIFQDFLDTSVQEDDSYVKLVRRFDREITSNVLVRPLAYCQSKTLFVRNGVHLPPWGPTSLSYFNLRDVSPP